MAGRLQGKTCLITGTGGSMGRAAALSFAREGAFVVGCDVNAETGLKVVEEVRSLGGEMVSLQPCDLTRADDCRQVVELAIETFGAIDVLFNNAAMAYFEPFANMADTTWYNTINEELHLVFTMTRAAWPALSALGGSVVSTASGGAWIGSAALGAAAHSAAKGAIVALTRQLAVEGAPHGIRVNSISPGLIETLQTARLLENPEWRSAMLAKHLLGRAGTPDEVANVALFLASDESSFITGADIRVDGGASAC